MKRDTNKYRVNVYLGKDLHAKLTQQANILGVPLSTYVKIILTFGEQVQTALEKELNKTYGN